MRFNNLFGGEQMGSLLPIELGAVVLDCPDIKALSNFYIKMLGWVKTCEDGDWIDIQPPRGGVRLGFQANPDYVPPVWRRNPRAAADASSRFQSIRRAANGRGRPARDCLRRSKSAGPIRRAVDGYDRPCGHPFCFVLA